MHVAICAVELYCYKNPMSRKLSQSSLIWLLDSLGLSVSTLGTMTITLDFLKSSSRGGPRVPRPLLPSASRPKFFTRYSTVPSFATFKKSHAPPSFRPPPFLRSHTRHLALLVESSSTRDKWSRGPFVARLTPPAREPCPPARALRAPATHLAHLLTAPSCIHMYARNGAVWSCTARPKGPCIVPPICALWSPGNPIWNYAGSRTRNSWKVVCDLLVSLALKV